MNSDNLLTKTFKVCPKESKLFSLLSGQELFHFVNLMGFRSQEKDKDPKMNLSNLLFLVHFQVYQYCLMNLFLDFISNNYRF